MKIGMNVPPHMDSAENLFTWVKRIEAGPFTTLSVLDRIVYPNFEPLITLAAAAALTNRVRLMTEVLISPIRNTAILAKESATLDRISNGRLTLGLGIGARENDYTATGVAYTQRGKQLEEQLHQLKRIWTGQTPKENRGLIGPDPIQKKGPELLLGGFAPRAIQRVAHFADGFITAINNSEQVNQTFRGVEKAWQEAGRTGNPRLVAQIDIALESHTIGQGRKNLEDYYTITPEYREYKAATMVTTEQQLSEILQELKQIGADEVMLFTWSTEYDQIGRIEKLIK